MLPKLSNQEFEALTQGARILEKDGFGLKVLRLPDARILKIFRRRHWFSSQLWAPHAQRFDRNAKTLLKRGIPTISVEQIFALPAMQRQAVLYHELPGITLRQWLREHESDEAKALIEQFGRFVAKLHTEGVLFRSLHFGNVLVTPEQNLALIDIVDMSFRRTAASRHNRESVISRISIATSKIAHSSHKLANRLLLKLILKLHSLALRYRPRFAKLFLDGLHV